MGRQSARLLYQGKDHKNIYFQAENESSLSGKALRMHFQMYKGSELVWGKKPPNFLLFGRNEDGLFHIYESIKGAKFDDLGNTKSYTQNTNYFYTNICKIKNRLFALGDAIAYTDNWFSWKELDSNIYNGEAIINIANHNEKLLIYTTKNLFLYDIDLNEKTVVYSFEYECDLSPLTNVTYCSSKDNTTVVAYKYAASSENNYVGGKKIITIHDSNVEKVIDSTDTSKFVITSNDNYFLFITGAYFLNPYIDGDDYDVYKYVYSSKDGITWSRKDKNGYLTSYFNNIPLFFKGKFYYIDNSEEPIILVSNEDGSDLEKIDYKIDLTSYGGFLTRNFCIAVEDYIYYLKMDKSNNQYYLIRFKDFYSDDYETVIENSRIYTGIYSDFNESKDVT